jgi:hypothetical protein
MKNKTRLFGIIALAAAIVLSMAACGDGAGGGGGPGGPTDPFANAKVVGSFTADKIEEEVQKLTTPGYYIINVMESTDKAVEFPGLELKNPGVNIMLRGGGGVRAAIISGNGGTITWTYAKSSPQLFRIDEGTLALENITLQRAADDPDKTPHSLIVVTNNGTLEIRNGAVITNPNGNGVTIEGGRVTMSGGEIKDCKRPYDDWPLGIHISQSSVGASFTMSGGVISGNSRGVWTAGKRSTITISGGTISGNDQGVAFTTDSSDCTLTISGGNIKDNTSSGVAIGGSGITVKITGGTISGSKTYEGVAIGASASGVTVTITGGTISGNKTYGVGIGGSGNNVTITGGIISGNTNWGLQMRGANNEFRRTGGTIYGKNPVGDPNSNTSGAIQVARLSDNVSLKSRSSANVTGSTVYAAKIDSTGDGLAAQQGTWDK